MKPNRGAGSREPSDDAAASSGAVSSGNSPNPPPAAGISPNPSRSSFGPMPSPGAAAEGRRTGGSDGVGLNSTQPYPGKNTSVQANARFSVMRYPPPGSRSWAPRA